MRHAGPMAHRSVLAIPVDLRARLETARLDLLALFRALDRMDLSAAEIPQRLIHQLFEMDADYGKPSGRSTTPKQSRSPRHAARHLGITGTKSHSIYAAVALTG